MITFEKWGEQSDVELYAIKYSGNYVARLALDHRPQLSNVIIFDSKRLFPVKIISEVTMAIRQEFGEMDIRVGSS